MVFLDHIHWILISADRNKLTPVLENASGIRPSFVSEKSIPSTILHFQAAIVLPYAAD